MTERLSTSKSIKPAQVFIAYSRRDKKMRMELVKHLKPLERQRLIKVWYDHKIIPGRKWKVYIDMNLKKSDVILLLVSLDFFESEHCWSELTEAMKMHNEHSTPVIPVLLTSCHLKGTDLDDLQQLPSNGLPVSEWEDRNEAWLSIVGDLPTVIEDIIKPPQKIQPDVIRQLTNKQILILAKFIAECLSNIEIAERNNLFNLLINTKHDPKNLHDDCIELVGSAARKNNGFKDLISALKKFDLQGSAYFLNEKLAKYSQVNTVMPLFHGLKTMDKNMVKTVFCKSIPDESPSKYTVKHPEDLEEALYTLAGIGSNDLLSDSLIKFLVRMEVELKKAEENIEKYTRELEKFDKLMIHINTERKKISFEEKAEKELNPVIVDIVGKVGSRRLLRAFIGRKDQETNEYRWKDEISEYFDKNKHIASAFDDLTRRIKIQAGQNIVIELLFPREMFMQDVEQYELTKVRPSSTTLSKEFPVVFRWETRIRDPNKWGCGDAWDEKFKEIHEKKEHKLELCPQWINVDSPVEYVDGDYFGFIFGQEPCRPIDPKMDSMLRILSEGAPFVFWLNKPEKNRADVKTCIETLVGEGKFEDLPRRLHKLKKKALNTKKLGFAKYLSLLWDIPDHQLDDLKNFRATTPPLINEVNND